MLIDVYTCDDWSVLYMLLEEREPHQNISHKQMPEWSEHCLFVRSRPYLAWYYVKIDDDIVGAVYITRSREIGVGILKDFRGRGYATQALREIMELHPGRHLANINPHNHASVDLFRKVGFKGPIQVTYEAV